MDTGNNRAAGRTVPTRSILSFGAIGVLVILLIVVGWRILGPAAGCSTNTVINVAAVPDMTPALQDLANRYNASGDSCGKVQVTEQDPADVLNTLTGRNLAGNAVDVDAWVPDSDFWLDLARTGGNRAPRLHATGISVARSPVVLAAPARVAHRLRTHHLEPSWRLLLGDWAGSAHRSPGWLDPMLPDPRHNVAGLAAMTAAREEMAGGQDLPARLTGFVRGAQKVAAATQDGLVSYLTSSDATKYPIGAVTEQAVWQHNDASSRSRLVALYPREGTADLDYPYAVTARGSARRKIAESFGDLLKSSYARGLMQQLGFRKPNGHAGRYLTQAPGVRSFTPRRLGSLRQAGLESGLKTWNRLGLGSRLLAVADVSPSSGQTVPGTGETRLEIGVKAATEGLGLFPDETDLGLWTSATDLDGTHSWHQVVSLGPITQVINGQTRRKRLLDAAENLRPRSSGGSGLYDSILAAFRYTKRTYHPDMVQSVLVFAASKDTGPHGSSLRQVTQQLRSELDPRRPVEILVIGLGNAVDFRALDQIVKPTGGAVYTTEDPDKIDQIFLKAVSRRICVPECPAPR